MITIASVPATHWHHGHAWDGPPWPGVLLLPLLLATAFIAAVLVQRRRAAHGAVEIVATRYAQGEIDEDEYRRRIAELRRKGSSRPAAGPT